MKRLFLSLITILFCGFSYAQMENHLKWTFYSEKTKEGEATLFFKAKIDKGWHVYSQYTPQDSKTGLAPIPMAFEFEKNKNYSLVGKVDEDRKSVV